MKKNTSKKVSSLILAAILFASIAAPKVAMAAEAAVETGTISDFAILAGETITNTGTTEITGDAGLHPGTAVPGKEDIKLNGEWHLADAVALTGKNDLVTAYVDLADRTPQIISRELAGQTLTPGVYASNEKDFLLNGQLTLDGEGDPDAIFIFQTDTTLKTGSESSVVLTGNATPCGVFWKVGSSATLGTYSSFVGRILALTSITLETGAKVEGQLLARNGSVTLDANEVISGSCSAVETATLNIIKLVENGNGETSVAGDFNVHVLKDGLDVAGSPAAGLDAPGRPYTLAAGSYVVTEEVTEGYFATYSGDSSDGTITLAAGDVKTIIITNYTVNGMVVVSKFDDKGYVLPGAEFTLYQDDVKVGESMTTDENGEIIFTKLAKGNYTLRETKAPAGYVLSDVIEEISIVEGYEQIELTLSNRRITGHLNIMKVDAKTGTALAGAEFLINDALGEEFFKGTTDEDGLLSIILPYGKYVIEEVTAPENYIKSDAKFPVDITEAGQIFNLEIKNVKTEEKVEVLPNAGSNAGSLFLVTGILTLTGGILLLRKKQLA